MYVAHIEVDTNDLTLLAKDIDVMKEKLDNLRKSVSSNFKISKSYGLYSDGFNRMNSYISAEISKLNGMKSKLEKYQSEMDNTEKAYSDKFNNIGLPDIQYSGSNLTVIDPSEFIKPKQDIVNDEGQNQVNYSNPTTSTTKSSSSGGGVNVLGAVAGVVGAIGIGGVVAAAAMKKSEDEDKELEETKDKYTLEG